MKFKQNRALHMVLIYFQMFKNVDCQGKSGAERERRRQGTQDETEDMTVDSAGEEEQDDQV